MALLTLSVTGTMVGDLPLAQATALQVAAVASTWTIGAAALIGLRFLRLPRP